MIWGMIVGGVFATTFSQVGPVWCNVFALYPGECVAPYLARMIQPLGANERANAHANGMIQPLGTSACPPALGVI